MNACDEWVSLVRSALAVLLASAKGWTVVDMKQDWKKVFAFEP